MKWDKREIFIYATFGVFLLAVLYFLLNPIIIKGVLQLVKPRIVPNMDYARNYYTVVAAISSTIIGLLGITLGYFYYQNKKTADDRARNRERKRKTLEVFMSQLNHYDENIRKILSRTFSDEKDLAWLRVMIEKSNESMQYMLDPWYPQMGFQMEDIQVFVKLNSFVDKCDIIMRAPACNLSSDVCYKIIEDYNSHIRQAFLKCHQRIV